MSALSGQPTLPDHLFTMPLLREVASADHGLVRAASRVATFEAGETIYRQGAPSGALALLVEGRAKLSVPSAHGRELVVSLIEPCQSFGEIGFLDGLPRSLDAAAILPSSVVLVRRAALLEIMGRTPALAMAFAEATCKRLRRITSTVHQAIFYGVKERLADRLLHLAAAIPHAPDTTVPTLTVWQHELADMVGMTRESVNKQLRTWHADKLIRLSRGQIALMNVSELSRIAARSAD